MCHLHQTSSTSISNPNSVGGDGTPPRFIGVMYDRELSNDAARLGLVMARFCEALTTIRRNNEKTTFAPCQVRQQTETHTIKHDKQTSKNEMPHEHAIRMCLIKSSLLRTHPTFFFLSLSLSPQALFTMTTVPSVPRLQSLLPRYARVVFEVTPGQAQNNKDERMSGVLP